jgi:tRNA(Ile)-lysidine synthase
VLPLPGKARFGAWELAANVLQRAPGRLNQSNGVATALFDADSLGGRLSVRGRRPGDRFQPLGMTQPKKLQDVLVDAHIPRSERDALPLVCSARGIVWVPGGPPAEWAKVRAGTTNVVRIRASNAAP